MTGAAAAGPGSNTPCQAGPQSRLNPNRANGTGRDYHLDKG